MNKDHINPFQSICLDVMSKTIQTFSEKISTGSKIHTFPAKASRSFFRNYQEVEIQMGPPNFQKLMKELRAWQRSGKKGPFRATLKSPKNKVRLDISGIEISDKAMKQKINRMLRDWGSGLPVRRKEFIEGMQHAWKQGWSPECVNEALIAWEYDYPFKGGQIYCLKAAFPDLADAIDFPEDFGECINPRVPAGNNYHPSVGWY